MAKRKPLSKRARFEVFKRDRFKCQYCGRVPPAVTLQVDHVVPVSQGGKNGRENLVTACVDCNSGKSDIPLGTVVPRLQQDIEQRVEQLEQVKAFHRLIKRERSEATRQTAAVVEALNGGSDGCPSASDSEKRSISMFVQRLGLEEVLEAADIAVAKHSEWRNRWKYFCGVCWKKAKGGKK